METKQVPWWRKALDFALSGLRSGFGLFSRTETNHTAIEPEIAAGQNEFREETELTDYSPAQNPIAEAPEKIDAASEPEIETVAVPEVEEQSQTETEDRPEEELRSAAEGAIEPEPDQQVAELVAEVETVEQALAEADVTPARPEPNPDPVIAPEPVAEADIEPEPAPETEVTDAQAALAPEPVTEEVAAPEPAPEAATPARPETEFVAVAEAVPEPDAALEQAAASEAEEEPREEPEQPATAANEAVDEAAPEAQSAISEDSKPVPASPAPDKIVEIVEPVVELSDGPIEEPAEQVAEIESNIEQTAEQVVEPRIEPNGQEITEESTDGTVEPQMEMNRPNSETAAEQEQVAETAMPVASSEDSVAAPEAAAGQIPQAVAEPGTEPPTDDDAPIQEVAAVQHPSKPFIKREPREGEADNSPFSVIVSQVYDGPLDLLLDLIRKQDIDIYDIPIARITAQFLAYVDQLKAGDVDVAGEFIYTASLLIHIKSKMLLPRAPSGPEDAAEDPRRELVERLLEHERFKNAAQMLQQKQLLEAATWTNPGVSEFKEDTEAEPEIAADTVDLVRVFRDILERARNRPVLNVQEDSVTVGQMIQFVSRRLSMEDKPMALRKLLSHSRSERALIAMFLALLELVRLQAILLRQDRAFSEIFVKKHSNFENVMTETASAQDDWK